MGVEEVDGGKLDVVRLDELLDGGGKEFAEEGVGFGELFAGGLVVRDHFHASFLDALFQWDFAIPKTKQRDSDVYRWLHSVIP